MKPDRKRPANITIQCWDNAIVAQAVTPIGAATKIVLRRPNLWFNGAAKRLPKNAPHGGIALTQEAIFLSGISPGFNSCIEGIPGDENPRTNPM